mmetsp:Transcript_29231/g.69396  ORF Transcript_29231/g.69396 Transcript_29231/m.69396 type:complete len:202 (-) Transcript_29231:162-767(-)
MRLDEHDGVELGVALEGADGDAEGAKLSHLLAVVLARLQQVTWVQQVGSRLEAAWGRMRHHVGPRALHAALGLLRAPLDLVRPLPLLLLLLPRARRSFLPWQQHLARRTHFAEQVATTSLDLIQHALPAGAHEPLPSELPPLLRHDRGCHARDRTLPVLLHRQLPRHVRRHDALRKEVQKGVRRRERRVQRRAQKGLHAAA